MKPYTNTKYAEFAHNANQLGKRIEETDNAFYALADFEKLVNEQIVDISASGEYIARKNEEFRQNCLMAVQFLLDDKVKEKGYDNIVAACSYANSGNPVFRAEGLACLNWRDSVWTVCHQFINGINSENLVETSLTEFLEILPKLVWS